MRSVLWFGGVLVLLVGLLMGSNAEPQAREKEEAGILKEVETGNPEFGAVGALSFAGEGVLLVADPARSGFVAINTGDTGPVEKLEKKVENVKSLVAAAMGTEPADIKIADMTVNPLSGKIYLSVNRIEDRQAALMTIDSKGQVSAIDLKKTEFVRIELKTGNESKISNITDLKVSGDRVLVAAQSNEEFASKVYSVPFPLTNGGSGDMYSTETYHVAHGRWETRAPIQSFIPHEEDGKQYVVGAFACTPIAKFPLADMTPGGQVKGTSVVELGSGNQPLDMFTYEKDGKQWLVTNTYRFHFKKSTFGPSKWWGVRVDMDYLEASETNEKAARREVDKKNGPNGIEILDVLFGAVQVAKLGSDEIVVLRADAKTDSDAELSLEVSKLP